MKIWLILSATLVLTGCQTTLDINSFMAPDAGVLKKNSTMYVAIPEHLGYDEERAYKGSDFQTAEECAKAFKPYSNITLGREPETLASALKSAQQSKCNYLVKPEIRLWEDNPTEWTGERDELQIDVEIFDVSSGQSIAKAFLKGKSRFMTFGDKPERMLPGFFDRYAANLFGESVKKP